MISVLGFLGSKIGRWLLIAAATLASGAILFAKIFSAGEAKQKLTDAHATLKAATQRTQVNDQIVKGGAAAADADLAKWVRRDP